MTHEQKPESAEFRTSSADNKEMCIKRAARDAARRTREEQIRELIISFEEYEHTPVSVPGYAHKMILEAEIRAVAAEQRRKDAEDAEPVGYASRVGLEQLASGKGASVQNIYRHPDNSWPIPLYTRPANVAALEDWVKELEGEAERRIADAVAVERERCATLVDRYVRDCMDGLIGNLFRSAAVAIREGGAP